MSTIPTRLARRQEELKASDTALIVHARNARKASRRARTGSLGADQAAVRTLQDSHVQAPRAGSRTRRHTERSLELLQAAHLELYAARSFWPPDRQPWPSIIHELAVAHMAAGHWIQALRHMLTSYFGTDSLLYPEPWHPVRVVHNLTLASLVLHVAMLSRDAPGEVKELERYELDYGAIVPGLLYELSGKVDLSHGPDSSLAAHVKRKLNEVGVDMTRGDARPRVTMEALEREWTKLRQVAQDTGN